MGDMSTAPLPELRLQAYAYTVFNWIRPDARDEYDLNAPYQRDSVWTIDQRRNLIKSLLMGLPVGSVVVSDLGRARTPGYRIVDGKQRLETVRLFVDDQFDVPGSWFTDGYLTGPAGRAGQVLHSQLSREGQMYFKMRQLPAVEFKAHTETTRKPGGGAGRDGFHFRERSEDEMLRAEAELYLLLNFGGVPQGDADWERAARVAGGGDR